MGDRPLARYTRILEAVAAAPQGMTLAMIAETVGLQPATSHRLVNSLVEVGLLRRQEETRVYLPGLRLMRLCLSALTPASVVDLARPLLRGLVATFGETAYLAKLGGTTVESVAMEVPQASETTYVQPGRVMPFHASASARAIAAFQPEAVVAQMLAAPRQRFTADTITDAAQLRAALGRVREQGYAVVDNELDPGIMSLAVPVRGEDWGVVFSIGLLGLSERMRRHERGRMVEALTAAGNTMAQQLRGHAGPGPASGPHGDGVE